MRRGEAVRCTVDYDLFDCDNVKGEEGCYIDYSEVNKKHLIYFPECGEWAELEEEEFERINKPGHIPKKNRKFIEKLSRMKITLIT
tara:strand:+ start:622 stop:879 length:258 start_codon:yes stop_codon:yes gene_type:complete